jgi:hypothetical protein
MATGRSEIGVPDRFKNTDGPGPEKWRSRAVNRLRRVSESKSLVQPGVQPETRLDVSQSGRWDSNPRRPAWESGRHVASVEGDAIAVKFSQINNFFATPFLAASALDISTYSNFVNFQSVAIMLRLELVGVGPAEIDRAIQHDHVVMALHDQA